MEANRHMIVLAREAAGMTQNSLAHAVGVSQAYLSKIEHGLEDAPENLILSLASECDVPPEFLIQTDQVLGEGLVDFFHRKRLTLPAKPLKKAQAQANITRLEVSRLLQSIDLTEVSTIPELPPNSSMSPIEASEFARSAWRIPSGPIPNLLSLIEKAGIAVLMIDLGHNKLSAISMPSLNGRHVILLNSNQSGSNQRFSLAHELGHLVMHNGVPSNDIEREADEFAASFLMPQKDIDVDLKSLRFKDLGSLKKIWRVSYAALIRRAKDLNYLTERQYRSFFIELNKIKAGSLVEPDEFQREEPRLLKTIIEHYQSELDYSVDDIARVMVLRKEILLSKYLGMEARTLKAIGRPALYSLSLGSP